MNKVFQQGVAKERRQLAMWKPGSTPGYGATTAPDRRRRRGLPDRQKKP
jgi:hypothetical protein